MRALNALIWSYWMDEAAADVYGVLNMGPTFAPSLAAFLAAFRAHLEWRQGQDASRRAHGRDRSAARATTRAAIDTMEDHPIDLLALLSRARRRRGDARSSIRPSATPMSPASRPSPRLIAGGVDHDPSRGHRQSRPRHTRMPVKADMPLCGGSRCRPQGRQDDRDRKNSRRSTAAASRTSRPGTMPTKRQRRRSRRGIAARTTDRRAWRRRAASGRRDAGVAAATRSSMTRRRQLLNERARRQFPHRSDLARAHRRPRLPAARVLRRQPKSQGKDGRCAPRKAARRRSNSGEARAESLQAIRVGKGARLRRAQPLILTTVSVGTLRFATLRSALRHRLAQRRHLE